MTNIKTSTIKEITGMTTYTKGQHGTIYYYTMLLENGSKVNIGKKSNTAFQLGDEVKYIEVEAADEYGIIKIRHPKPEEDTTTTAASTAGTPSNNSTPINMIGFAMSYAKDLVVAGKMDITGLEATADLIYNWMKGKL